MEMSWDNSENNYGGKIVPCEGGKQTWEGYYYPGLITTHPTGTEDYSIRGKFKVRRRNGRRQQAQGGRVGGAGMPAGVPADLPPPASLPLLSLPCRPRPTSTSATSASPPPTTPPSTLCPLCPPAGAWGWTAGGLDGGSRCTAACSCRSKGGSAHASLPANVSAPPLAPRPCSNMDNRRVMKGNTLYLPVEVAGAYLSMGDAHLAQGDSELDGTGIETSINGRFKLTLHKVDDLPVIVQVRVGEAGKGTGGPAGSSRPLAPADVAALPPLLPRCPLAPHPPAGPDLPAHRAAGVVCGSRLHVRRLSCRIARPHVDHLRQLVDRQGERAEGHGRCCCRRACCSGPPGLCVESSVKIPHPSVARACACCWQR